MEWADALVWEGVLGHAPSADDPFVRDSLLHLHLVQRAYLTGFEGGTPESRDLESFSSLEAVRDWGREFYPRAMEFLGRLTPDDLLAKPAVLWPQLVEEYIGQPPVPIPLGDMVYQVASHSVHHRAQVNRRIRELGGEPPFIDYVAWAWLGEPEPVWPT